MRAVDVHKPDADPSSGKDSGGGGGRADRAATAGDERVFPGRITARRIDFAAQERRRRHVRLSSYPTPSTPRLLLPTSVPRTGAPY